MMLVQLNAYMLFPQFARQLRWVCPRRRWWLVHPIWKHRWPPACQPMESPLVPSGVCVCVCVFNHKSAYTDVSLCHGPDSLLMRTGGRQGCREKWPPESTRTLMGRSPFRVTTFWCPAERHTRRRSPALPPTTRRSSLTASPSMFSVSLSHTWLKVHN